MTAFVDMLHRDEYSLKNALGNTPRILPLLKDRGQTHYAVANYGEISNWVQQMFTCRDNGIVPILGMETYINAYRREDSDGEIFLRNLETGRVSRVSEMSELERDLSTIDYSLALYAMTVDGYYNIIQIHNDAQLNGVDRRPRTYDGFLREHGRGVVAILPTPYSEVSSLVFNGMEDEALRRYRFYESIFDRVYLSVTLVEDMGYREINDGMVRFARRNGLPIVPVINSHYISPSDDEAFTVLKKLARLRGGMSYECDECPGMHYRTLEEVEDLYRSMFRSDVFTEQVFSESIGELARLVGQFTTLDIDCSLKLPRFKDGERLLREKAEAGFRQRGYDRMGERYRQRLEYELDNIIGAGFADYFLVLEEMFTWYRDELHSMTAYGRGSAAGSLVLNCIGCTNVDPIKYNLLFERFLDAERFRKIVESGGKVSGVDCPDVDSDLATNKRDLVKKHLVDRYGLKCTASIGTAGLMKTKSTLKDLARLYEVPMDEINNVTSVDMGNVNVDEDEDGNPVSLEELERHFPSLVTLLDRHPEMGRVFEKLRGSISTWGIHAGGVLISDTDLTTQLPVRRSADGKIVTCWQEGIASRELGMMGFIKFDMLAIDQLNIIEDALRLIRERTGKDIDPYTLPLEDYKALQQMNVHNSLCIFQFDTDLSGRVTDHMKGIRCFEDLASLSALMRPAALQNGFDREFGGRRGGQNDSYLPDCLKTYLEGTYGLPIYQEHIMQASMAMAGFDKVTAYKFMKLIYKGKLHTQEEKDEWRSKFVDGCQPMVDSGEVRPDFPNRFFDQILAFLGYGFCKSHALCYSFYSYVGLWLKAYYPLEFLCANLSVRTADQRVKYAQSIGIAVYPPDVRYAGNTWTIHEEGLMAPLSNIKGLGASDASVIADNRPYSSMKDFLDRTRFGKSKAESLVLAGALDCFGDRNDLLRWCGDVYYSRKRKSPQQMTFFDLEEVEQTGVDDKPLYTRTELDARFFELNGFYIQENLKRKYASFLADNTDIRSIGEVLSRKVSRKHFLLFCKVGGTEPFSSRSGANFVRIDLTDGCDSIDTVMRRDNYSRYESRFRQGNVVVLPCQLDDTGTGIYIDNLDKIDMRVIDRE